MRKLFSRRKPGSERGRWSAEPRPPIGYLEELQSAQADRCAICEGDGDGRALSVDHDHHTGKIRGLLCGRCNFAVACESPELLRRAAAYLERGGFPGIARMPIGQVRIWNRVKGAQPEVKLIGEPRGEA